MKNDESLSDKIELPPHKDNNGEWEWFPMKEWVLAEDVKEAVKKLKQIVVNNSSIRYEKRKHFMNKINEVFGDKLI